MAGLRRSRDWLRPSSGTSVIRSMDPSASTRDGVARSPNRFESRPFWSKKKGRPWARIRSSGRPARSTILAGRSWPRAQATSVGREPSMNSRSRVSGYTSRGLIRAPRAAIRVSVVRPDIPLDRDGRIEQPGATDARGPDALDASGRLDAFPGPVQGLAAHAGQLARGLKRSKPGLDPFEQVGLGDRPHRAAHAEVLCRSGPRRKHQRAGRSMASRKRGRRTRRVMAAPPQVLRAVP